MERVWQVQEAKARFSEFLDASLEEGPQIVTRRGIETAVLLPIGQWRRLTKNAEPDLKALLLSPEPRTEALAPTRKPARHRKPPNLE